MNVRSLHSSLAQVSNPLPPLRDRLATCRACEDSRDERAFTLLEVILAIAILAISLGYIGTIVTQAFSNSASAADGLEARIVGQTIIDQLKCGSMEIADAGPMQLAETEIRLATTESLDVTEWFNLPPE